VSPSCRELQLYILTDDGGECQQSWLGESDRWKKSFWRLQRIFSCRLRHICYWRRVRLSEAMRFCWTVLGCSRQMGLLLTCCFDASVWLCYCCVAMFPCVTLLLLWWFVLARIMFCCSDDVDIATLLVAAKIVLSHMLAWCAADVESLCRCLHSVLLLWRSCDGVGVMCCLVLNCF